MGNFMTFADYLERREADLRLFDPARNGDRAASIELHDLPMVPCDPDPVSERSMFRGVFKAVNPARPASPTNSTMLASPSRKRLKGQVMGR
jgi:hypothetical protein